MDKRVQIFDEGFSHWDISLSKDMVSALEAGNIVQIVKNGWTIKVLFDEDDTGKFMDFYQSHRMTNDQHYRIRADGTAEFLPALHDWSLVPAGLQSKYRDDDERVMKMLNEKGFGVTGSEHPSFLILKYQSGVLSEGDTEEDVSGTNEKQ